MKKISILFVVFLIILSSTSFAETSFSLEEQAWLEANEGQTLILGFDPYAGMDYFAYNEETYGYLIEVVNLFNKETGLNIVINDSLTWGKAYSGLYDETIDILFGANPTEERLITMSFTEAIHMYPYTVLTKKNSAITTIGDLDNEVIGFIEGDIVKEAFQDTYSNIHIHSRLYIDQHAGMEALSNGNLDAFITSGGEVVWDYLYNYPEIHEMVELSSITSDMTFSTLKKNDILVSILNKIILEHQSEIEESVSEARQIFVRKILRVSKDEEAWLSDKPSIRVGVPNDYLPIDYFDGDYTGVAGEFLKQYSDLMGVKIIPVSGSFDEVFQALEAGKVDVLNMAKTDDRLFKYIYTEPFSKERDEIFGLRQSEYVHDIYGLEGYRVAVIEGFWHEEHLKKNLMDITIVKTKDISETLDLINSGKVDYYIENPTVSDYYIDQLGYNNVVVRGETSSDSYLYFGVQDELKVFVNTFNKSMVLMDYDRAKYEGLQKSPSLENVMNKRLSNILLLVVLILIIVVVFLFRLIRRMIAQRADIAVMKEREQLMYIDALTGLNNRLYFNEYSLEMDGMSLPQGLIVADLNGLKKTNDTYGHQVGDLYIKTFSDFLLKVVDREHLMRMGGDEFLICLPDATEDEVKRLCDVIKNESIRHEIVLEDGTHIHGPHTSVGYAMRYDLGKSVDEMFHDADTKMYEDKSRKNMFA